MSKSEIQAVLTQLESILEKYKVNGWPELLEDFQRQLREADDEKRKKLFLQRLDGLFGGMGSFGDIVITHMAGHAIRSSEESVINGEFRRLRSHLYELVEQERAKDNPLG